MKKRNVLDWLPHGILISLILVGYTTKTAKDTEQSYHTAVATGAVLGTGAALPKGREQVHGKSVRRHRVLRLTGAATVV